MIMLPSRRLASSIAAALLALLPATARAGMMTPCTAPGMFPDAAVTVFVFPYVDHTSQDSRRVESPAGTELAGLIQADTLLAISRFGNVAAIRLLGRPEECQPERVFSQLLDQFGSGRPDRAVVMIWGRIFQIDSEIYVQSYTSFRRFVRDDPGEAIELPFGNRTLVGQLASQKLAFAPRHVSKQDLQAVRDRFARENIVHETADENSPGRPLQMLFPNAARPAYYLTETRGDWIHIQAQSGQNGWILARAMLGQESLSARLPEMRFVEGVAGYFSVRATRSPAQAEIADVALRAFDESPLNTSVPAAVAVARELRGFVRLLSRSQSPAAFDETGSLFASAAALVPSSSEAGNLASIVWLYSQWLRPGQQVDFQAAVNRFWISIAANPSDRTALTNCWTVFTVARAPEFRGRFSFPDGVTAETLGRKASAMEQVQIEGTQVALQPLKPVVPWPAPSH